MAQEVIVRVPHSVLTLMEYKGQYWLTNTWMVRYQGMLCENPHIHLKVVRTLNPATLLPVRPGPPDHDCVDVMDDMFSSRPELTDQPLKYPNAEYFTDGSSFVEEGKRHAGSSVVALNSTIEVKPLQKGTSAQKAELITLTQALHLAAGIRVNIYTDSKYVFITLHAHGALYKKKGLINLEGKNTKYGKEIIELYGLLKRWQSYVLRTSKGVCHNHLRKW